jgi:hypothetical protein
VAVPWLLLFGRSHSSKIDPQISQISADSDIGRAGSPLHADYRKSGAHGVTPKK